MIKIQRYRLDTGYKDTGEKLRLVSNCTLKGVSSYNHSRIQEKKGRAAFPNATGKSVGTEKTEIFPFILTCRYSSISASSPTHWHHPLTGSSFSCLHSFYSVPTVFFKKERSSPFLPQIIFIKELFIKDSLSVDGGNQISAKMPPTIVTLLHALLPTLEPPCGCSQNYSPTVSCSATALLHSSLCNVKRRRRNTETGDFR